jgi:hypothetical protein
MIFTKILIFLVQPKFTQYFALLLWLIGCLFIVYMGMEPYTRRPSNEYGPSSVELIITTCGFFSLYYIWVFCVWVSNPNLNRKFFIGFVGLCVLAFEFFILALGAMHAPPIWFGLWIGILISILFHCIWLPFTLLLKTILANRISNET